MEPNPRSRGLARGNADHFMLLDYTSNASSDLFDRLLNRGLLSQDQLLILQGWLSRQDLQGETVWDFLVNSGWIEPELRQGIERIVANRYVGQTLEIMIGTRFQDLLSQISSEVETKAEPTPSDSVPIIILGEEPNVLEHTVSAEIAVSPLTPCLATQDSSASVDQFCRDDFKHDQEIKEPNLRSSVDCTVISNGSPQSKMPTEARSELKRSDPLGSSVRESIASGSFFLGIPVKLGNVTLAELLENDGLCAVFRAWHEELRLPVVVKVLMKEYSQNRLETNLEIQKDLESIRLLAHPSIMRIWDFRQHDDMGYLVMDDYDGPSISEMLDLGLRFRVNRVLEILDQVIEALWVAREHGVCHRFLTSSSLRLPKVGVVRIGDLGLGRLAAVRTARLVDPVNARDSGCLKASYYLAPEMVVGKTGNHLSDIYSIGSIIYHALTGTPPHSGGTPVSVLSRAAKQAPTPPHFLNREVDEEFSQVILKMMAINPDNRYPNYMELRRDVTNVAKNRVKQDLIQDVFPNRSPFWSRLLRLELSVV